MTTYQYTFKNWAALSVDEANILGRQGYRLLFPIHEIAVFERIIVELDLEEQASLDENDEELRDHLNNPDEDDIPF